MRTETVTTNIFKYDELSDDAKECARDWYRDASEHSDYSEDVYEDAINARVCRLDIFTPSGRIRRKRK